jgi:hypothetical protein
MIVSSPFGVEILNHSLYLCTIQVLIRGGFFPAKNLLVIGLNLATQAIRTGWARKSRCSGEKCKKNADEV